MILFETAQKIILDAARLPDTKTVTLAGAAGYVLAQDVVSDTDMPPFDRATMDGYACKAEDIGQPLKCIGLVAAGSKSSEIVRSGQCIKIMTGAPVPEGANCVVMREVCHSDKNGHISIEVNETPAHIAPKGQDLKKGDVVVKKGTRLKARHIGILSSFGCASPTVYRKPKLAILVTGDELVSADQPISGGQIRDANSPMLTVLAKQANADVVLVRHVKDNRKHFVDAMKKAADMADVVLVSGGASVGDFDYTLPVMEELGLDIRIKKVAVKPGKPLKFGVGENVFVFGLPGNPVSAFMQFLLMVRPFLDKLAGQTNPRPFVHLPLAKKFARKRTERAEWFPVRLVENGSKITPVSQHTSGHLASLATVDGAACIALGQNSLKAGELAQTILF